MAKPQTAEAMIEQFRAEELLLRYEGEQDELLAKAFRRYARQVGEAGREYDAILAEQLVAGNRKYAATSAHDGGMATAGTRISNAIRARRVECP